MLGNLEHEYGTEVSDYMARKTGDGEVGDFTSTCSLIQDEHENVGVNVILEFRKCKLFSTFTLLP